MSTQMFQHRKPGDKVMLLASLFASSVVLSTALAQSPQGNEKPVAPTGKPAPAAAPYRYQASRFPAKELGQIEGTLDFCSQLNPQAAPKYKERGRALVGHTAEKDLVKARSFDEYKESHNWIDGELRKASKEDALKACTDFVEEK